MKMKKIIITLVLLGLLAPGVGGAVVQERPSVESCTLKHNLSGLFGPGFEKDRVITSNPAAVETAGDISQLMTTIQVKIDEGKGDDYVQDSLSKANINATRRTNSALNTLCHIGGTFNIPECDDGITWNEMAKVVSSIDYLLQVLNIDITILKDAIKFILGLTFQIIPAQYYEEAALACLVDKIETAEDWFFIAFLVVAGVLFLYGAFIFLTAAGRPESIKSARNLFLWGAVGLVIAFVSKGLVNIIAQMMT